MKMAAKAKLISKPDEKNHSQKNNLSYLAKAIISKAGVGIYVVQHGKFVYVSQLYQKLTGYSEAELIGTYSLGNIYPDDREMVREEAIKCLKEERFEPYEYRFINKKDEVMWVLETITPIVYKEERATLGSFMDITGRKKVEEKLRHEEQRFRALAEQSSDIIVLVNREGIITYENPAVERYLGLKAEERIGVSIFERIHPDDLKLSIDTFNTLSRDINAPDPHFEIRLRNRNGSWHTFELVGSKMIHENVVEYVILNLRDITERKQAESQREAALEALRQSEEKYRSILETIQEGYFEVDFAGNFTFFNDSLYRNLGYSKEELMGMNNRQYTDKEYSKKLFQAFNKVYNTGEPTEGFDWQIIRKDGTKRSIEASVSLQKDSSGKPTGFRGIARDVTERKQAEEKLLLTLESLRKAFGTIIKVMVSAVEMRDPYTSGHQIRSADLARAIATEMGLPQDKINGIRLAGSIHDIGKLSIPAEILSKPSKLTNIEFSLIKEHSRVGYEMLKDVESPWPLAQIVYQHHERIDGSGYPKNLKGDEIIIEASIMAVADVVEAMASHRPYRPALGIKAALEEIKKNKGILYDEAVADTCLRLFLEKNYQIP